MQNENDANGNRKCIKSDLGVDNACWQYVTRSSATLVNCSLSSPAFVWSLIDASNQAIANEIIINVSSKLDTTIWGRIWCALINEGQKEHETLHRYYDYVLCSKSLVYLYTSGQKRGIFSQTPCVFTKSGRSTFEDVSDNIFGKSQNIIECVLLIIVFLLTDKLNYSINYSILSRIN